MANVHISDLTAGVALTGTEAFEAEQPFGGNSVYLTANQVKTFISGTTANLTTLYSNSGTPAGMTGSSWNDTTRLLTLIGASITTNTFTTTTANGIASFVLNGPGTNDIALGSINAHAGAMGWTNAGANGILNPLVTYTDNGPLILTPNNNIVSVNGFVQWSGQARVTSDFAATSNTTLSNVTGLSVTLQSGNTYTFDAHLFCTTGAANGGIRASLGGNATITSLIADGFAMDGATLIAGTRVANLTANIIANNNTGTTPKIHIRGALTVNVGGTLTIQFCQQVSNATSSNVKAGSWLQVFNTP